MGVVTTGAVVAEESASCGGVPSGSARSELPGQRVRPSSRMLVAWCPDWPAAAALREAGLSADLPAMVLAAGRVRVATVAARTHGIRVGMRRRDAVSRCPEVLALDDDPGRDARMFEPVAAAVEEVAPGIEVLRPGLIACGARGPTRYFGSEDAAAERIVDIVEAFDLECRVGIAAGLQVAVLAARQSVIVPAAPVAPVTPMGEGSPGSSGSLRGLDRSGLRADALFCATLPLTELGRDPAITSPLWGELIGLLIHLGITTAGEFAALPVEKVATRFGADGVALHRLASGRADRDLSRRRIETDITVGERYDPPLDRVDTAAFAARALAVRFHDRLAAAGLVCTRLDITATTERGDTLGRTWRCIRPLDAAGTADRLRWQLDGWLTAAARRAGARAADTSAVYTPRRGAITELHLSAVEAVDAGQIQYSLWGADGFDEYRAGSAFARVQGLLGTAAVRAALRSGGRGPADRVSLAAWGEVGGPDRDPAGPWPGALPAPAPADVSMSEPVDVCDRAGYRVDVTDRGMLTGPPASVAGRRVLSWAGPWLLDERWWAEAPTRAQTRRRARMQVVTDPGPPVLLELGSGGWLVEAVYD